MPKKRGKNKMPTITKKGKTLKVICPFCSEKDDITETKAWILEGGIAKNVFRIHLYLCGNCGKSFKKAEPI